MFIFLCCKTQNSWERICMMGFFKIFANIKPYSSLSTEKTREGKKSSALFSVALFEQISNIEFMQMFYNYVVLDDEFVKCHFLWNIHRRDFWIILEIPRIMDAENIYLEHLTLCILWCIIIALFWWDNTHLWCLEHYQW